MGRAAAARPVPGDRSEVLRTTPPLEELRRQDVGGECLPVLILQVEVERAEDGTDLRSGRVRLGRFLCRHEPGKGQKHPDRETKSSMRHDGPPIQGPQVPVVGCTCESRSRLAGAPQAGRHAFEPLPGIRGDLLYLRPISQAAGREQEVGVDQPHQASPAGASFHGDVAGQQ
jgi:hypothetical protein